MGFDLFSVDDSLKLRESFLQDFTDNDRSLRLQLYTDGYRCMEYIWEHLSDCTVVRSSVAVETIADHGSVYVMQDMMKHPDEHRLDIPFPRDRIARISGAELAKYLSENFPPPMGCFVFDDSFKWHITVTNEYDDVMIDGEQMYDCICFVSG